MNCYFLIEDSKSLLKVLPDWLKYMKFPCSRVLDISAVTENNYILQSGYGVVQLVTCALFQTFDTIIDSDKTIDELVLILDSEDLKPEERLEEVNRKIEKYENIKQLKCTIHIFIVNCCFESWLLCNSSLYPSIPPDCNHPFYKYYCYYNIKENDPEKMEKPPVRFENAGDTRARIHFSYFHEMCLYNKKRYNKHNTDFVKKEEFFNEIVSRVKNTNHGCSFKQFYEYITNIN